MHRERHAAVRTLEDVTALAAQHAGGVAAPVEQQQCLLAGSQAQQRRCVLIITGKGFRAKDGAVQTGILRASVPRWLNEAPNRARILAFASARDRHGGGGALYVLLKRLR